MSRPSASNPALIKLGLTSLITVFSAACTTAQLMPEPQSNSTLSASQLGDDLVGELVSASPVNLNDGTRYSSHLICSQRENISLYRFEGPFSARFSIVDSQQRIIGAGNRATSGDGGFVLLDLDADECVTLIVSGQNTNAYGPYTLESVAATGSVRRFDVGQSLLDSMNSTNPLLFPIRVDEPIELEVRLIDASGRLGLTISGEGFRGEGFQDQAQACGDTELRLNNFLMPGDYDIALLPGQRSTSERNESDCSVIAANESQAYFLSSQFKPISAGMRNGGPLIPEQEIIGTLSYGRDNQYYFSLDEPAQVTIELGSSDFDTVLELHGDNVELRDDDGGEGANSEINTSLIAGDYQVLVQAFNDSDDGGEYSLQMHTQPLDEAFSNGGPLEPGSSLTGLLVQGTNRYSLTINERSDVILDLTSDNFDTFLVLEGNGIDLSDDDGGEGINSRLETTLEPGTYTVQVEEFGGVSDGGLYTLSFEQFEATGRYQNDGDVSNEVLSDGAVITGGRQSGRDNEYPLHLTEASWVFINVSSPDFDPMLELRGSNIRISDDDGGSEDSARIATALPPGHYRLLVQSYHNYGDGEFNLSTNIEPFSGEVNLGHTSQTLMGKLSYSGNSNRYYLTVEEPSEVTIDVTSNDFDTLARLVVDSQTISDDDGGEGSNSRIQTQLDPGTYYLEVSDYGTSAVAYEFIFTIHIELSPLDRQTSGNDGLGDVVADQTRNSGLLRNGDEVFGELPDSARYNEYQIRLDETSQIALNLASSDFAPLIKLSHQNEYEEGLLYGSGTDVQSDIEVVLLPGEYSVQVHPSDERLSGQYDLRATIEPFEGELTSGGDIAIGDHLVGLLAPDTSNEYNLTLDELTGVAIEVASVNFYPLIALAGNDLDLTAGSVSDSARSQLETLLEPGTYQIRVSRCGDNGGIFSLNVDESPGAGRLQDQGDIKPGDLVFGQMRHGQALEYRFITEGHTTYNINATSHTVDTVLRVNGNNLMFEDDNGGQGTNAQIRQYLPPGEYAIQVGDHGTNSNGVIRLEIGTGGC